MASILLSFVGSQDPFAKTETEGSIVTLTKHLLQVPCQIKRVVLLYTSGTAQNAADTADWLSSEPVNLAPEAIDRVAVDEQLSLDPVNLLLAVQAARVGIGQAQGCMEAGDVLEFNSSSGTPVMKGSWGILQAAGYAVNSRVWQVRNPKEMQPGQALVFQTNVDTLRQEFEVRVAKQQIQDYNYSGALVTLRASNLLTDETEALLHYGYYRSARDFDRAASSLDAVKEIVDRRWIQEIALLRQKDARARLQEAYFNAQIRLNNRKYADFLIDVFGLQESLLKYLVQQYFELKVSGDRSHLAEWEQIKQVDQGKLYQHLLSYKLPRGGPLRLGESINRYVMIAILDYSPHLTQVMPLINYLNDYCDLRNRSVHEFAGVSGIQDEAKLLSTLKSLMKRVAGLPEMNPFDLLNQQIFECLTVL
jgi:CRISPR-associated protein (Cas_Csm6)